jgi:HSP20 family protein
MLTQFGDFERPFTLFDELRRRMDRVWTDFDAPAFDWEPRAFARATWPHVNVFDAGASLVVTADVPGMTEKDLTVSLDNGTLSLRGERKVDAPEGYSAHRQERGAWKFSRSLTLPSKVDPEKTTATVKEGVLTVTLAKAPEAQPRQIAVRAQ